MKDPKIHWLNLLFIVSMHLGAVGGVLWLVFHFSWATLGLALAWFVLSGMGITFPPHGREAA